MDGWLGGWVVGWVDGWMSAGCGWGMEPPELRSQSGPWPSRILGFCSVDPSRGWELKALN